ncbi:immunoglobulin alpha Fc receptor-like [Microtus oregoni]|uniref:immunoglobulin alpha Fc receptor-like n=1 Tax=Microtus oregoni TaxID=111838 RepID=UPI001BB25D81|nr:immunoglobulin alpha Fc receptor-like [Microtus oregoni]
MIEFTLKNITHSNAGVYYCEYFRGDESSRSSDSLELVVTGIYNEKPFLSADAGPQEISKRNVTLLCHTHTSFDTFILCRGGNASFPQSCSRQDHNTFLISPVRPGHRRTYRCFASLKHSSYLWSVPSDLLEFSIPVSNYRLENYIRLILAIIILLGLGSLLLDAWSSRESP